MKSHKLLIRLSREPQVRLSSIVGCKNQGEEGIGCNQKGPTFVRGKDIEEAVLTVRYRVIFVAHLVERISHSVVGGQQLADLTGTPSGVQPECSQSLAKKKSRAGVGWRLPEFSQNGDADTFNKRLYAVDNAVGAALVALD